MTQQNSPKTSDLLPQLAFSGKRHPADEVFTLWQQSIAPFFEITPSENLNDPAAQMSFAQIHAGGFILIDSQIPAQTLTRSARWLRRNDDADHILLQTFLYGNSRATCGGQQYLEEDQGVFAVNLGYESQGLCSRADVITLVLPRHWLSMYDPRLATLRGRVFEEGSVAEALFRNHMIGLRRHLPHARQRDIPRLSQSLLGLLGSLHASGEATTEEARPALLGSIQSYIEDNLASPLLTVQAIQRRYRLSRATLFRLFQELGGVAAYIQRRRLLACFRALSDPRLANRRVYDVALDYGLTNPSYLGTLFRAHFGMLPSEVRDLARGRPGGAGSTVPAAPLSAADAVETMQAWAKTLGATPPALPPANGNETRLSNF